MASRTKRKMRDALKAGDPEYGKPSPDGSMRKAIAYHGTSSYFDKFDASFSNPYHSQYGGGFYLASTREKAALHGNHVYEVEITYSTDMRTAKRTGRQQDFQYIAEPGYWVIPHSKAGNLKITRDLGEDPRIRTNAHRRRGSGDR